MAQLSELVDKRLSSYLDIDEVIHQTAWMLQQLEFIRKQTTHSTLFITTNEDDVIPIVDKITNFGMETDIDHLLLEIILAIIVEETVAFLQKHSVNMKPSQELDLSIFGDVIKITVF